MAEQFINELQNGQTVTACFAIDAIYEPKKYNNKPGMYIALKAYDRTGEISVKIWGKESESKISDIHASLKDGDIVLIENGKISLYHGKLEIHISEGIGKISKATEYSSEKFLGITEKDIPGMKAKLKNEIESISNYNIKRLLGTIFNDDFMETYSRATAAKKYHHNYIGGLLEHVLSMTAIAKLISEQYKPGLNVDLLIAGCMLHDIGKVVEYKTFPVIDYTAEGRLLGHIAIGYRMVEDAIDNLENFPSELKVKILHMILSHHTIAYGSAVDPMFPEAIALHAIDVCDAQIKNTIQAKKQMPDDGRDFGWNDGKLMYLK